MEVSKWKVFYNCYTFLCVAGTLVISGFWAYQFSLDESLFSIEFKEYHKKPEDIFPFVSLCFSNSLLPATENGSRHFKQKEMVKYLKKEGHFLNISSAYEETTFNLHDYVKEYFLVPRSGTGKHFLPSEFEWNILKPSYLGYWSDTFFKCYSIQFPPKDVHSISVRLNNTVFPEGIRPTNNKFVVVFHYPHQILAPNLNMKYIWESKNNSNNGYTTHFFLENVEIFRRRKNCYSNWMDYDNEMTEQVMKKVGCRLPYYNSINNYSVCSSMKEIMDIWHNLSLAVTRNFLPPCKGMEKINYRYEEKESGKVEPKTFWIDVTINEFTFKVHFNNLNTIFCSSTLSKIYELTNMHYYKHCLFHI